MDYDWPDIPDTPEQRALIAELNAEIKRKYPNLVEISALDPKEIPKMTQTLMQMVKEYKDTSGQKSSVELSRNLVWEEYEEWEYEVNCPRGGDVTYNADSISFVVNSLEYSAKDELKELTDLVYVLGGYALAKGWDLDEALKRVHANNVGRMFQPDGSILRRDDGKILKNKGYAKVDLEDLV
jgi:hypothetical protein